MYAVIQSDGPKSCKVWREGDLTPLSRQGAWPLSLDTGMKIKRRDFVALVKQTFGVILTPPHGRSSEDIAAKKEFQRVILEQKVIREKEAERASFRQRPTRGFQETDREGRTWTRD